MRGSTKCLVAAIAAGALQLFPPTSVFLMFIGGWFYFGVLLNLSAAILMYEVISARAHRALLILPAALYAGYTLYAYASHIEADRVNGQIAQLNSLAKVKWDPQKQALMLSSENASGDENSGRELVEHFDINSAYASPGPEHDDPTLVKIQERPCPGNTPISPDGVRYWRPVRGGYPSAQPAEMATDLCVVAGPAITPPRRLLVFIQEDRWHPTKQGLVSRSAGRVWIKASGQPVVTLHYGRAMPATWFPMPIMGCGVGGAGELGCFQSFLYEQNFGPASFSSPSLDSKIGLVAKALGIRRKPLWGRYPRSKWKPKWKRRPASVA
jgi:hypothetical protein